MPAQGRGSERQEGENGLVPAHDDGANCHEGKRRWMDWSGLVCYLAVRVCVDSSKFELQCSSSTGGGEHCWSGLVLGLQLGLGWISLSLCHSLFLRLA